MKRDNDRQTAIILSIVGIVPVIWLALLIAPSISGGLPEIAANLATLFDNPFSIKLCGDSLKTVLILLLCYGMGIGIYFSTRKNYRRREEHGSAKWGNVRAIDKKYRQKPLSENKLMTQNVCIGLNAKKHRRNLNTLVCGGSGAGKTRFYATHKYVSELLGKETIDTNTFGKSTGRSGNYSTNYQISGRELLTPDEVRMLDNQYAILFIRGERPIMDFKYDIMKHPNVALTTDGKASPYKHGEVTKDIASIAIWDIDPATLPEKEMEETNWELLSDEEMEALFINNQTN